MNRTSELARQAIVAFQQHIAALGFCPAVHFELEGCCQLENGQRLSAKHFDFINRQFKQRKIAAKLVDEYWHNQWEYVSEFAGQTPLQEAEFLSLALKLLPNLFARQGVSKTLIKPVVWSGDDGQMAMGSRSIFTHHSRAVHIPNAIQVNVSVFRNGKNLIPQQAFGELLQRCLMNTSLSCCLLYLPEEEAYERLALKTKYGLAQELCSPIDISGGHQGSIALYKEQGKHNQPMGVKVLLEDINQQALLSEQNWQETARVEHRLGAASLAYDPFINVAFTLANVIDALEIFCADKSEEILSVAERVETLPTNMYHDSMGESAYSLFARETWFSARIEKTITWLNQYSSTSAPSDLGTQLKRSILTTYQPSSAAALVTAG
ncbi:hypothetical protein ACFSJY_16740 [Thalassotalea euphylliae]|uniref:hypothetical protein n=1 Tax=Thalassotalea euphylliae TaxID=1655234 RepID=UPI003639A358